MHTWGYGHKIIPRDIIVKLQNFKKKNIWAKTSSNLRILSTDFTTDFTKQHFNPGRKKDTKGNKIRAKKFTAGKTNVQA